MDEQKPEAIQLEEQPQPEQTLTDEETLKAKEAVENEKRERSKRCHDRIEQVLNEENCSIDVTMILKAGKVIPQADVVAK